MSDKRSPADTLRAGDARRVPVLAGDLAPLRRQLLQAVRRVCPSWLRGHAEDITQEAFVRVVAALEREGETKRHFPPSYLRKAAYTATVDTIRRYRLSRLKEVSLGDGSGIDGASAPVGNPEREVVSLEIGDAIEDCLDRLVEPRQVAVILHLQGHTAPEISRLSHWPLPKTKNLVYRGLDNLRRCLSEKGFEP